MHPEAYLLATLIGLSLGLIGGGGSILTVPVLVYVMGISPVLSTAYSLFIVGATSIIGAIQYAQQKLVDFKTGILFCIPSIAAVYLTRKFLIPFIPDPVFTLGQLVISKELLIMLLFAVLMILASVSMILPVREKQYEKILPAWLTLLTVLLEGAGVGVLTGLVGAGGGFLIIPALVLLTRMPMKKAIGTSLLIIALKSLIGFTGDLGHQVLDWNLLVLFTLFAIAGMFLGTALSKRIGGEKLKPAFGWFVLVMGVFIVVNELYLKH
ncbi:MAG TPA: sulfite exporter TauE/SafE family protein [Saprospiraceae bacterium]|nr:sulfite exporter TauE/SafE family protein [Saprospiraceae bacterium]HNT21918.1 sulfite exporter TauE/SafE family protein [Saprospiraceae bacterium]